MLRFDDCLCGTTTTGTGTLSLAAIPSGAGGGIDPDVWARATGVGFGNSAALLVDYTLTEYTDATFATEKQKEAGIGTLTLGSSSGIANATLARTTIDWTLTSLNSQPASASVKPGTGISIGTAANVIVMCAPRTESIPAFHPYYESSLGDSNWGVSPEGFAQTTFTSQGPWTNANADVYVPFRWSVPMPVKRCTWRIQSYTAPTGTPVVYARIYDFNSNGRPGKLLYDFTSSGGVTINSSGNFSTGASGNGFMLMPGDYWLDFALTGVTASASNLGFRCPEEGSNPAASRLPTSNGAANLFATTSSGATAGPGPDPANTTGYALVTNATQIPFAFGLSPT